MLTAKNISAKTAVDYFLKGSLQKGESRWYGRGAKKLNLTGAIDNESVFSNVVNGVSPDGSKHLNAKVLLAIERRAALDCTFSAPKSVSLIALVNTDERVIATHRKSIEQVLDLAEERYAQTRVRLAGKQTPVNTGNLVIAAFDHIESRELDPHLHTHCLIMNATQAPNGRWQSLRNDEIFANKKLLGMTYQGLLATGLQELGYEVSYREHGQFEIDGFDREDLLKFSNRLQQMSKAGSWFNWLQHEKFWSNTRQRKANTTAEDLLLRWQQQATGLNLNFLPVSNPKLVQGIELTKNSQLEEQLKQEIDRLDDEELCDLVIYIADYFEEPGHEFDPQLQKMQAIRKVLKAKETKTLERLTAYVAQPQEQSQRLRFSR